MIQWAMALIILFDTVLICTLYVLDHKNVVRYVKLEEWAEDWLKRLEQKHDALESQIVNVAARIAEAERKIGEIEKRLNDQKLVIELVKNRLDEINELLPKDQKGEILRNHVLLQQLNDEMERNLQMEKDWNDGVAAILNYGKPITEVNKNE